MSDTGPAFIASLIGDEEKYRTFVVLKLQEHSSRLDAIEAKVKGVSSSADDYDSTRDQIKGGWKVLTGIVVLGAAVWGFIQAVAWFVEKIKP